EAGGERRHQVDPDAGAADGPAAGFSADRQFHLSPVGRAGTTVSATTGKSARAELQQPPPGGQDERLQPAPGAEPLERGGHPGLDVAGVEPEFSGDPLRTDSLGEEFEDRLLLRRESGAVAGAVAFGGGLGEE